MKGPTDFSLAASDLIVSLYYRILDLEIWNHNLFMAVVEEILRVGRGEDCVSLYMLVSAVKGVSTGKREWKKALERNLGRQVPILTEGKIYGKSGVSLTVSKDQILLVIEFVLTDDENLRFFNDVNLVAAVHDLTSQPRFLHNLPDIYSPRYRRQKTRTSYSPISSGNSSSSHQVRDSLISRLLQRIRAILA